MELRICVDVWICVCMRALRRQSGRRACERAGSGSCGGLSSIPTCSCASDDLGISMVHCPFSPLLSFYPSLFLSLSLCSVASYSSGWLFDWGIADCWSAEYGAFCSCWDGERQRMWTPFKQGPPPSACPCRPPAPVLPASPPRTRPLARSRTSASPIRTPPAA